MIVSSLQDDFMFSDRFWQRTTIAGKSFTLKVVTQNLVKAFLEKWLWIAHGVSVIGYSVFNPKTRSRIHSVIRVPKYKTHFS